MVGLLLTLQRLVRCLQLAESEFKNAVVVNHRLPTLISAVPIFDGQLSAIAAELEGCDPEECQVQVRVLPVCIQ
jgi:hypothetical protein